ncbi:uncharacterized mitochondrial protein AtMg00810-like [Capsicum annuum]|uniref:uncharacterized mitochondrial protein AtMg00810-like n=1 Tax=Capsicum annuum TaxID=4072 RepID=UPI001FB07E0A|nr:uncharacterized mitochondrial protein AtMg00810-like [Capsicum annuum]
MRSENEPTLYVKKEGNDFIIVRLYVDDIIYTNSSEFLMDNFKSQMMNEFEMLNMELFHYFLGLEVHQIEDGIFLAQRKYGRDLLNEFGMLNCMPVATPMNINEKLQQVNEEEELADARRFRSLVGGLIYLTYTRPDIAFSVGVVSRFMQQPPKVHYDAAKKILYTDSNYGSSLNDRRSV